MKAFFTLALLLVSIVTIAQDSTRTKSRTGLRGWLDRRNERLERQAEDERLREDRIREAREKREEERRSRFDIPKLTGQPSNEESAKALQSAGGQLVGAMLLPIISTMAGTYLLTKPKPQRDAGIAIMAGGNLIGFALVLGTGGQLIKAGRNLR